MTAATELVQKHDAKMRVRMVAAIVLYGAVGAIAAATTPDVTNVEKVEMFFLPRVSFLHLVSNSAWKSVTMGNLEM